MGIGPGDPELLTIKAVNIIKSSEIIAVPGESPEESTAYKITVQTVPEIAEKTLFTLSMPMIRDENKLSERHRAIAENLEESLEAGKDVAFLTLGDPSLYSTFCYIRDIVAADGFNTQVIPGIMSISAVAARLGVTLAQKDENVHIIALGKKEAINLEKDGTYVFMKPSGDIRSLKKNLADMSMQAKAVSNLGMSDEKVYEDLSKIPDEVDYFTVIIARK